MKCNVGNADRMARGFAGLVVLGLGLYFQSFWGLLGLIPLTTAYLRWCPAYVPFGLSTAGKDKPQ
jgi:hypothetical protein